MRAHLSSPTFDLDGFVTIDALPDSDWGESSRRVNRIATLDTGAVMNDFGFTDADRTMRLAWVPVPAVDEAVTRLMRLYGRIRLACHLGVFSVAPERLSVEPGRSVLTLLVLERLA